MPAKKTSPSKKTVKQWKPDPLDAINLAAIRYYVMELEQLAILIYASDAQKGHPLFKETTKAFARFIAEMQKIGKGAPIRDVQSGDDCGSSGYVFCDFDQLCHPPGTCS